MLGKAAEAVLALPPQATLYFSITSCLAHQALSITRIAHHLGLGLDRVDFAS
jgi:hypothetical protein